MFHTMKELPKDERPYEKCLQNGPGHLTDAELLAVIIRTGIKGENSLHLARRILQASPVSQGLLGLAHLSLPELLNLRGVGEVKAVQIQCIVELAKRISKTAGREGAYFNGPEAIAHFFMEEMRHKEQEEMRLLMLNTKNKLIKDLTITKGTVNASLVSPRELFLEALKYHAVFVILMHNHPSGDPEPSKEDFYVTKRIKEAGALIGIPLIDHIIIGDNTYISLKERGMI